MFGKLCRCEKDRHAPFIVTSKKVAFQCKFCGNKIMFSWKELENIKKISDNLSIIKKKAVSLGL